MPPAAKKAKIEGKCTVCTDKSAQYRCPGCLIVYCSLPCYKTHKQQAHCANVKKEPTEGNNNNNNNNNNNSNNNNVNNDDNNDNNDEKNNNNSDNNNNNDNIKDTGTVESLIEIRKNKEVVVAPKPTPPLLQLTVEEEERDRVSRATLAELSQSGHLKNLLANKHLRDMLTEINESHNPDRKLEGAMQFPIFTEFVDECMSIVDRVPDET